MSQHISMLMDVGSEQTVFTQVILVPFTVVTSTYICSTQNRTRAQSSPLDDFFGYLTLPPALLIVHEPQSLNLNLGPVLLSGRIHVTQNVI
jgi:hypothetical protein